MQLQRCLVQLLLERGNLWLVLPAAITAQHVLTPVAISTRTWLLYRRGRLLRFKGVNDWLFGRIFIITDQIGDFTTAFLLAGRKQTNLSIGALYLNRWLIMAIFRHLGVLIARSHFL